MGGGYEPTLTTLTGMCPKATEKLLNLGYIMPLYLPEGGAVIGSYVLTSEGRTALGGMISSIPARQE
ncbi:hypothetical protein SAMN04488503_2285 [Humidesulfovibrio mexicanus]|uniref:Uncharacterized protein n=1 Tax=Humidesulfovibrio mexicanus TaxID=147047 RepID=A0A239AX09_9BACT|nr:hypothetical protein [Humidesulfovibrio mexicanus]SNS00266.1 hypothetical protein SAMN04488503_2285 [Humidesulfovibrio mexicanus]